MDLDARLAHKVSEALTVLDGMEKLTGLRVDLSSYRPLLVDRDGNEVAELTYAEGRHLAVRR